MTPDAITRWLDSPAALPDSAAIKSTAHNWPWFVPARIMEAADAHQQAPFSDSVLAKLSLCNSDWLSAYALLSQKEEMPPQAISVEELTGSAVDNDVEKEESMLEPAFDGPAVEAHKPKKEAPFIQPFYTEDYFRHQGIASEPEDIEAPQAGPESPAPPQTLMVVMSFAEWLTHFKTKSKKDQEEAQEKSALRSMWQQEKLAAALDDEPEEIPEDVFEMAVSSITLENDIASESLAQIYERQEKWSAAAEMYRKLALKYPAKSTYFATRAEAAKKRLL